MTDETAPAQGGSGRKIPLFGARKAAREAASEADALRAQLEKLGAFTVVELDRRRQELDAEIAAQTQRLHREREVALAETSGQLAALTAEREQVRAQLDELRGLVVVTEELALLQEVGVYEYRHPLSDSVAYKAELARLRDQIKAMARVDGGAVLATTDWTVNGSRPQGRAMVRDFSKLLLRAYNAEADNLVRGLKPYKLGSAVERLTKVADSIARLGRTMDIRISAPYHALRVRELEFTADYLEKLSEEKEREREERERLKEERRAQQELDRERARLEKERTHYENALAALEAKGDSDAAARMRDQIEETDRAIADVDYRAANVRAGYVYVISNLGALGDRIVKIGMTRRIDPLDRVRELGDASVPFKYDVHALFFSNDAVGIEAELHRRLADRRVNRINLRREFFYATPAEVRDHLAQLTGDILSYEDEPEALEFRQSLSHARAAAGPAAPQVVGAAS